MKKDKIILLVKIFLITILTALIGRLIINNTVNASYSEKPKLAIVIDDFGNASEGTEEITALPIKLTGAVMPYMPYTIQDMELLIRNNKEVILHQPMEAHTGKRSWLGETPILDNMSINEVKEIFAKNSDQLSKATGFNNHMGSLITEDKEKMTAILEIAKEKNWFYIDCVTTADSVAYDTAKELGIPAVKRDVFLDSTQNKEKIKENITKAINIAKEKGSALAIGHVGPEGGKATAQALKEVISEKGNEVEFVYAGEIAK